MKDIKDILRISVAGNLTELELNTSVPQWDMKIASALWTLMAKEIDFRRMIFAAVNTYVEHEDEIISHTESSMAMGKIGKKTSGKLS